MSTATTKADIMYLFDGKSSHLLITGQANTFKAKAGEHYRILKHQEGVAEQLVDDLIAKRSGNDLQLHYADGTEINLESYFTKRDGTSCEMTLPGDHGSEFKLSGDSAMGVALGDGSHLVYVHGSHDVVMDMAQSNSSLLSTLSGFNGTQITYIPPAQHDAVTWAGGGHCCLVVLHLQAGAAAMMSSPHLLLLFIILLLFRSWQGL